MAWGWSWTSLMLWASDQRQPKATWTTAGTAATSGAQSWCHRVAGDPVSDPDVLRTLEAGRGPWDVHTLQGLPASGSGLRPRVWAPAHALGCF